MLKNIYYMGYLLAWICFGSCVSIMFIDIPLIEHFKDISEKTKIFKELLLLVGNMMLPIMIGLFACVTWMSYYAFKHKAKPMAYIPAGVFLVIILVSAAIHMQIDKLFIHSTINHAIVNTTIAEWALWHILRTLLALGLVASYRRYFRKFISH